MLLGVYDYTVILTYFGMLAGFSGILQTMQGDLYKAMLCLMMAGICDMFDGKIASTKKNRTSQQRRFGIQIDSLSDLICFGVLPAVITYTTMESSTVMLISGGYVLSALIRLAWFNVDEEDRQEETSDSRSFYAGLPVTTAALILPAFLGTARLLGLETGAIAPVLLMLLSAAFLIPFRLKKPALPGKLVLLVCGVVTLAVLLSGAKL